MDNFKQRTSKHLLLGIVALLCNLLVSTTTAMAENLHTHRGYYMQRNLVSNNVDKHKTERRWNSTTLQRMFPTCIS